MINLPASPEAFRDAAWEDVLPYYNQLASVPLTHDDAVIAYLCQGSQCSAPITSLAELVRNLRLQLDSPGANPNDDRP